MKHILALTCISMSFAAAAQGDPNTCLGLISGSKLVSANTADKTLIQQHASNFCNAYRNYMQSGKSSSASIEGEFLNSAGYQFLSGMFSSSKHSVTEVASQYCSADYSYTARNDAERTYLESIAPGAFDAYNTCMSFQGEIRFISPAYERLAKSFSLTVTFSPTSAKSQAHLTLVGGPNVKCNWHSEKKSFSPETITLKEKGTASAICTRSDSGSDTFVKVSRVDGNESISFPWGKYNTKDEPVDDLVALQSRIDALDVALAGSIIQVKSERCPSGWKTYVEGQGRFIRGIEPDNVQNRLDPDKRAPNSLQDDMVKTHDHLVRTLTGQGRDGPGWGTPWGPDSHAPGTASITPGKTLGAETRPKNVALLFCEKL